jgi:3-phosphoglycerate kinase
MSLTLSQITNSTVLLRVNYDLPNLESIARIQDSIPTIKLLLDRGSKVVICTHYGRPEGHDRAFSTNNFDEILEGLLRENVTFVNQYDSFVEAKAEIRDTKARVILLENTRFNPDEKSKELFKREKLALEYSTLAEYFVDDAFAVSHRQEVTNHEIKRLLPSCLGLSYQKEIESLNKLKNSANQPFSVIMGGAKLETKLSLITKILPIADKLILGGMLCFTFVEAKRQMGDKNQPDIFSSKVESSFLEIAKELLTKYPNKIILPVDFVYDNQESPKLALDIGPKTQELFQSHLQDSKTIFWNGPMGYYEQKPFDQGTIQLGEYLTALTNCYKVIGGGDTDTALPEFILENLDFVSMGGGATLDYLGR